MYTKGKSLNKYYRIVMLKTCPKHHCFDKVTTEDALSPHDRLPDVMENCLIINCRIYVLAHEIMPKGKYEFL